MVAGVGTPPCSYSVHKEGNKNELSYRKVIFLKNVTLIPRSCVDRQFHLYHVTFCEKVLLLNYEHVSYRKHLLSSHLDVLCVRPATNSPSACLLGPGPAHRPGPSSPLVRFSLLCRQRSRVTPGGGGADTLAPNTISRRGTQLTIPRLLPAPAS